MRRHIAVLAAGIVLTACTSLQHEEMTLEEGAKQECRTITESGTILPKRICYNRATWAVIDERNKTAAAKTMDDMRSRRGYMDPPSTMSD
ncbi:MAG: hypothetical protein RJQ02_12015 [Hyphomonas sp.]